MSQDDLEPLPPDLRLLLRQGRPGYEPPVASREAALAFVAAHAGALGAAALVHGAAQASHAAHAGNAASAGRGAVGALAKLGALKGSFGIGGLIVGAAVGAASHAAIANHYDASTQHPAARPAETVAVTAPPIVTASAPAEIPPPREPLAVLPATAPAPPLAGSTATPAFAATKDALLGAETALIDMARTAVARGKGDAALRPLERHAREFPRGTLVEDREWLWIQALQLTGRTDDARDRAARFRAAFPRSMYLLALDGLFPVESATPGKSGESR